MYRGIDDVYQVLCTLLPEHGLVIIPRVLYRGMTERVSKSGQPLFTVACEVEFDLISTEDGSRHTARVVGEAMDTADKGTNKAMAVAYKYMAFMVFCIPLEGVMLDADAFSHEVAAKQAEKQVEKQEAEPRQRARPKQQAPAQAAAVPTQSPPPPQAQPPAAAQQQKPPPAQEAQEEGVDLPHAISATLDQHRDILAIAPNEQALRKAFAAAYTWASEIPDARQRTYVLIQITDEKDTRKAVLAAEAEAQQ
jgi:hypothetical protein